MREDIHKQAEHLILKAAVERLTPSEKSWLGGHLGECRLCTQVASRLEEVVRSVRSVSVVADPSLIEITRRRVRERGRALAPRRSSAGLLWISIGLTWLWMALSAPYIWRGCAWVGRHLGVPDWAWGMGFGLWWLLPALAVCGALALLAPAGAGSNGGYAESH